jgi:hypothetical protein
VVDEHVQQLRADLADRAELIDSGERDHPGTGQLLRLLGELQQLHARGDALLGPAERLRGAVLGQPTVKHRRDSNRLLTGAGCYSNPAVFVEGTAIERGREKRRAGGHAGTGISGCARSEERSDERSAQPLARLVGTRS